MIKTITAVTILLASTASMATEFSIIKPIAGKHFSERNHPKGYKWNENYIDSIGLGYRYNVIGKHSFDSNALYVNKNSVGNNAVYLHLGYSYQLTDSIAIGALGGFRNGYPKKALDREAKDFIASGFLQAEYCIESYCGLGMVAPNVAVANFKYKF